MSIKLYNTLTRKKETFKPIQKNLLKIYVCGVTVYDDVHIGHAMSYIYYDILINYFKHFHGYDILYIRNITDVGHLTDSDMEDKVEKRAKERKIHPIELVYKYTRRMWDNFDKLNLSRPNIEPFATAHLIDMQDWIKELLEKSYAYNVEGNIYFDISKFKEYGKFANRDLEKLTKDSRFKNDSKKKNPADFALWKKADPKHILQWSSKWGKGYPGWHLECSVMSTKYLGETFDIHGGGVEHVFPHHQNEIAQNYGKFEHKVVNYWVHSAMLMVNGQKMGKSLGNFITIKDYLKEHTPQALRYLFSTGHYRKPQNYTKDSIEDAEKTVKKLDKFIKRLQNIENSENTNLAEPIIENTINNFSKAMDDDLNTSAAWADIFFMIKELNKLIEKNQLTKIEAKKTLNFLRKINLVFKVFNFKEEECKTNKSKISKEVIEELIEKRNKLRAQKKWEEADLIRMNLKKKGIVLYDNKEKTTWIYE